jgi:transcriptional regulator of acetoin/glycerol metabolism
VRELIGAIEYACIVCDGPRILPPHLPPELLEREAPAEPSDGRSDSSRRYQAPDPNAEREAIRKALREADGNRTRAAAALGMGRTTLWQKLKAYGLEKA